MRLLLALALVAVSPAVGLADDRPAGGSGTPVGGLAVAATLARDTYAPGDPIVLRVELANASMAVTEVVSHLQAHERHYDPFTIRIAWPGPSRDGCKGPKTGNRQRTIQLIDAREESERVTVKLEPRGSLTHDIDLAAWAARTVNGGKPLAPGFYIARVDYTFEKGTTRHVARSRLVGFTIAGTPGADMCKKNPGWRWFGPR